jgi:hypothetical protein
MLNFIKAQEEKKIFEWEIKCISNLRFPISPLSIPSQTLNNTNKNTNKELNFPPVLRNAKTDGDA